ncbi:MAG TPA: hypothetical protein VMH22_00260 [bacterium]|nr:hypothetical protein [bacterium]
MRFFYGLLLGFAATGVNFIVLYGVVSWLVKGKASPARYIAPLFQFIRYGVFGVIVYIALWHHIGSPAGLLAGVTLGIVAFLVWQVINARNRRSS